MPRSHYILEIKSRSSYSFTGQRMGNATSQWKQRTWCSVHNNKGAASLKSTLIGRCSQKLYHPMWSQTVLSRRVRHWLSASGNISKKWHRIVEKWYNNSIQLTQIQMASGPQTIFNWALQTRYADIDQVWSILPAFELLTLDSSCCDANSRGGATPMQAKWI